MIGRRIKWRWHMLSNREPIIIVVWYAVYALCFTTSVSSITMMNKAVVLISFVPTIISYCLLGLVGEVFIGRQKLISFSVWIQWIAMILFALFSALKFQYYNFPQWLEIVLVAVPSIVQFIGLSAFQVTAIQFGIDQIQGAPSSHLSAFIYWYFCMEYLPPMVLSLVIYLLSNYALVTELTIQLGCSLLCVILLSIVLCVKSCFMFNWFSGDPERGTTCTCGSNRNQSDNSNPYFLVYRVVKFAIEHNHPLQRSAFTYWEDKIPSRFDLGKGKYGGPFTSEEVENVKTFLQLIKVHVSLLGIFIVSFSIDLDMYHRVVLVSHSSVLKEVLYDVVTISLIILLYTFLFLSYCRKCVPTMLKRVWIGAMLTTASALSMLLIESIGPERNEEVPCVMILTPYLLLVPRILCGASYIIFTVSLFEFITAQSPQTMKGILIGLYYTLRFGLAGLFILVEYHAFNKYPTHDHVLSCATAHYLETTLIGLLSLLMYSIVAYKYKPRERDEVINVHMFAEEYYTK